MVETQEIKEETKEEPINKEPLKECDVCGTWYDEQEGRSRPHRMIDWFIKISRKKHKEKKDEVYKEKKKWRFLNFKWQKAY